MLVIIRVTPVRYSFFHHSTYVDISSAPAKIMPSAIDCHHDAVCSGIDQADNALHKLNQAIHAKPELAYEEHFAHDTISTFLEEQAFAVTRKAHGLDTSFEAQVGTGGREVVFCAEYDALPDIGHACGHNLIETLSLAAFVGAAIALKESKQPGRIRILGTPAEEGGGGKIQLIRAGAFKGTDAALMSHAVTEHGICERGCGISGTAALDLIARINFVSNFVASPPMPLVSLGMD